MAFKDKFRDENRPENEYALFHGSDLKSIQNICRFGFNRSFCGRNATNYGKGVYFSTRSIYSNNYARIHPGRKYMIRALVLVGDTVLGSENMQTPPENLTTKRPYDSTCNGNESIFVCYHDGQCFPQYVLSYD